MPNAADDLAFYQAFLRGELTREAWTHEAHVRVAWMALAIEGPRALDCLRRHIGALNAALGNPQGYHETITVAYLQLVAAARQQTPAASFAEFAAQHPRLLARGCGLLLEFYRSETLFSAAARARFVPSDLRALAAYCGELAGEWH